MTTAVLDPLKPARSTGPRSVLAVFTGLLVNVVLSTATDLLLVLVGWSAGRSRKGGSVLINCKRPSRRFTTRRRAPAGRHFDTWRINAFRAQSGPRG